MAHCFVLSTPNVGTHPSDQATNEEQSSNTKREAMKSRTPLNQEVVALLKKAEKNIDNFCTREPRSHDGSPLHSFAAAPKTSAAAVPCNKLDTLLSRIHAGCPVSESATLQKFVRRGKLLRRF
jgi:hypothetical protein